MPLALRLGLAIVIVVLAAPTAEVSAQARRELRVGLAGVPAVLDPVTALEGATPLIARHVFDTLVTYRELSTDVEPALATRWGVSRDGLVWTFSLREHAKFHDGAPLTASDVAASFERHWKPEDAQAPTGVVSAPLLRGVPGIVKEVRAPDPRTLQIVLVQPYAPLLTVLAHPGFGVVRRVMGADGVARLIGSGPYRVVDASPGRLAVEAVPGHWTGMPRSERILFLDVAGDDQAEAELDSRALDVWFPTTPPRRTDGALSAPGLRVGYLACQTEKEPFSRKAVRHGLAAALDPAIIAAALDRVAVPLHSFLPPGVWARREGSPVLGGGREAARRFFAEGHWPKGFTPTMLLPILAPPASVAKLAEAVQQMLGAADIPLQLRMEPPDAARAALQAGDYELALTEATVAGGDPHLFLYPLSTSESAAKGPRALNYSYYRNPRLDDMLIRASQLAFRPERARLYQRAQATLASDLPWIPLYVNLHWAVARSEVRGLRLHPTGFHRLSAVGLEGS